MLFALGWAGFAVADDSARVGPAPVAAPLRGDSALEPILPPPPIGPVNTVSAVGALEPLPTEAQLREQALREAEARRPPPLKPRAVPQRVETLAPGRMLILPRETPLEGGTVSGGMFSDDTETLAPVATPPLMLEPLIGQMNAQAEAMERVVADMEARMDAMDAAASPTAVGPVEVGAAEAVSAVEVVEAPKPAPLPKPLVLPFVADVAGLGPANTRKLNAWLETIGPGRKVSLRITAHVLAPQQDGLGEDPAKLAERRAAAVRGIIGKAGLALSGRVPVVVVRVESGKTGGQRLVVSAAE